VAAVMVQSLSVDGMRWNGWGDPAQATHLSPEVIGLLQQALHVEAPAAGAVELADVRVPDSRLPEPVLRELTGAVGDHVSTAADSRIRHTRGKSTVDILRMRAGEASDAPDAVVWPGSHQEVLDVLDVCQRHAVAVVPFGGGTSVVSGLSPSREESRPVVVALDLTRMDRLLGLDEVSRTATFEPGVRGPAAEALLLARGFTLGHVPQSYEYATIGGFAATRSAGHYSAGYGRFDEMVVGLRVATPRGSIELGRAPRSAAGPDLRQLFLGSEGILGVITAITVRVLPAPTERAFAGWWFGSFAEGTAALRRLAQDGPVPTMLRLSDESETFINATITGDAGSGGCLAVVGYEGSSALARRGEVEDVLRAAGGSPVTADADEWVRARSQAPYLRDALLEAGALVETVETATFWANLPKLYEAVRDCLVADLSALGTPPLVACHISHTYPTGAALYFTVICAQADDPVAQWRHAKQAVNAAIVAAGGTITHHHAVGRDHAAGLAEEVGPLAMDVLRAVKTCLDPTGILNPGILLG
jgi:alkyldihydroxyacetonephosphate synthase